MPNFRRYYIPNAMVFITVVTRDRTPYLGSQDNLDLFWDTLREVKAIHPFRLLAYVVLPEHFHWLMRVDCNDTGNFSPILHSVKRNYTRNFKKAHHITTPMSLWQPRFWDHVIRDEDDLQRHFDYIHWNPVKHGLVARPQDWAQSTYRHWLEHGYYEPGWGCAEKPLTVEDMEFE